MSGWPAVLGAVVLFGSYGVPIKSRRVVQAQADAIVLQLFKAVACFGSSLGVLLFKEFSWTWWALLGAALWVATGTLAIYAIQRAGLGLAQTVYSSLSVLVSYLWGVVAFHEMGRSAGMALLGLSLMVLGLAALGHTVHATPRATLQRVPSAESTTFLESLASKELQSQAASLGEKGLCGGSDGACTPRKGTLTPVGESEADSPPQPAGELSSNKRRSSGCSGALNGGEHLVRIGAQLHHRSVSNGDLGNLSGHAAGGLQAEQADRHDNDPSDALASWPAHMHGSNKDLEAAAARLLRRRPPGELGIILRQNWLALRVRLGAAWGSQVGRGAMAAVLVGLLNGSFLVPFKLARRRDQVQGIDYVLPFAIASLLVTLLVCGIYYGLVRGRRPKLHSQAVAGPSLLTGVLWSAGNLCSIWAVQSFGLSVGFPLVQCQLIVSTAWALLYYKEVPANIQSLLLFVSATILVLAGMSLLAVYGV